MPYCRNCGKEIPEGATFCPNCGTPIAPSKPATAALALPAGVRLAGWGDRFLAWLIDIIIIGAIVAPLRLLSILTFWPWSQIIPPYASWVPLIGDVGSVVHFLYWTFMEGLSGQSIGKMVMRIKVTRTNGQRVDFVYAAIQSLGKAFLLPIDLIIGWIVYSAKRQRLFNYIADTIVVKT